MQWRCKYYNDLSIKHLQALTSHCSGFVYRSCWHWCSSPSTVEGTHYHGLAKHLQHHDAYIADGLGAGLERSESSLLIPLLHSISVGPPVWSISSNKISEIYFKISFQLHKLWVAPMSFTPTTADMMWNYKEEPSCIKWRRNSCLWCFYVPKDHIEWGSLYLWW